MRGKYSYILVIVQYCAFLFIFSFVLMRVPLDSQSGGPFLRFLLKTESFSEEKIISCKITAYCPGPCCNSGYVRIKGELVFVDWSNRVAVGQLAIHDLHRANIGLIAVDPSYIPYGSIVRYNGKLYIALDSGGSIKENSIDVSLPTHEETVQFGRRYQRVVVSVPEDPQLIIGKVEDYVAEQLKDSREEGFSVSRWFPKNLTNEQINVYISMIPVGITFTFDGILYEIQHHMF